MQQTFAYTCPHCQETVQITDNVLGNIVDCPLCSSPFKVEVPTAAPAPAQTVQTDTPEINRPDREEGELVEVHPAMFRVKPLHFIGYSAMVAVGAFGLLTTLLGNTILPSILQVLVSGLLLAAGGFLLLKWYISTRCTKLTVTTKRTILREGLIAKSTSEVQHDDVRNLQVDQNAYERVAGVGDLAVSSSGQDDLEIQVEGIPHPEEVADQIRDIQ